MSDVEQGDVVELFPGSGSGQASDHERPLASRGREPGACSHFNRRYELDDRVRRAYCRDCGGEIPAFDVLLELTRDWERYIARRKRAAGDAKRAEQRLEELQRRERNTKARIRSAKKKAGPTPLEVLGGLLRDGLHDFLLHGDPIDAERIRALVEAARADGEDDPLLVDNIERYIVGLASKAAA